EDCGGGRQTAAIFYRDRHALTVSFVMIDRVENFRGGAEKKGASIRTRQGRDFGALRLFRRRFPCFLPFAAP
ncbi:MAG: hypothetical protein K6U03_12580, partial [Firmicutes bacterium]|nr:hypothetical protein [Bacillota bacterium]